MPIILWLLVICYLSFSPLQQFPKVDLIGIDKLAHFGMYGILEFLLFLNFRGRLKSFQLATIAAFIFSASTELIQHYFIPFRYGDVFDFIANISALMVVYLIVKNRLKAV